MGAIESTDVVVIGAGVVGLACARALAPAHDVIVIERHARSGQELSSRNSGVVHAGVHHARDWLKTQLCVRGRALLEEHCASRGVPYRRTGKLIVATAEDERGALDAIAEHAAAIGIEHARLSGARVRMIEPAVACREALEIAPTGIVATPALVASLEDESIALGCRILHGSAVRALERGWIVHHERGAIRAGAVVVAAGLDGDALIADHVALDRVGGPTRWCAGRWARLDARFDRAVSRLVYPVPSGGGLGIHLTLDVRGALRAGPDAVWVEVPRVPAMTEDDRRTFAEAIVRYLPGVQVEDLTVAEGAIRPKLHGIGGSADFVIARAPDADGLVILRGIESPGLTASLAIGEHVRTLVG